MDVLAEEQLMHNLNLAMERLRKFHVPVIAFAKERDEPFIRIQILPPERLKTWDMNLKLRAFKPKGQPFSKTLYTGHLLDIPNIVIAWRGLPELTEETCH